METGANGRITVYAAWHKSERRFRVSLMDGPRVLAQLEVTAHQATMHSRPERVIGHTGTETRPRLLREAAVGNLRQWTKV